MMAFHVYLKVCIITQSGVYISLYTFLQWFMRSSDVGVSWSKWESSCILLAFW